MPLARFLALLFGIARQKLLHCGFRRELAFEHGVDRFGHRHLDAERLGVVALKAISDGQEPDYGVVIETFDAFNRSRMDEWSAVGWEEVWTDYLATRKALLLLADSLSDRQLIQPFVAPWRATTTACGYLLDMAQHEQEHAGDLRHAFSLPTLPRRLRRAV